MSNRRQKSSGSLAATLIITGLVLVLIWQALPSMVVTKPLPDKLRQTSPTVSQVQADDQEIVYDDDWLEHIDVTPIGEQLDVTPRPPSTSENPGWDLSRLNGNYTPAKLWFPAGRPQILTDFPDESSRNIWNAMQAGEVQYETWQYWENCVKNGISPDSCGTTRYYKAQPSKDAFLACLTVQIYGGAPCWEILSSYHMESANNPALVKESYAGAKGPLQLKDWFFSRMQAYPGGSQESWADSMFAAGNFFVHTGTLSANLDLESYAHSFRGKPCADMENCKYPNKAGTAGYNAMAWNNHYGESHAAYVLSKQLHNLWRQNYP